MLYHCYRNRCTIVTENDVSLLLILMYSILPKMMYFSLPITDGDDGAVNEPMHWVVVVRKNGKEIDRKTLTFEDGKEIATDDLKLYYK